MDRLLTDEERPNLPPNSVSIYAPTLLDKIKDLEYKISKAQDAKTAHLVAQEIIQDYENAFEPTVPMSITYEKHHAIKSKWGIE